MSNCHGPGPAMLFGDILLILPRSGWANAAPFKYFVKELRSPYGSPSTWFTRWTLASPVSARSNPVKIVRYLPVDAFRMPDTRHPVASTCIVGLAKFGV